MSTCLKALHKSLHRSYKSRVQKELCTLNNLNEFKLIQNALGLKSYDFVIANASHSDQVLSYVAKCYAEHNPLIRLFDVNEEDIKQMMAIRTDFVCNNGRMILALDQQHDIQGGVLFGDYCDHSYIKTVADFSVSPQADRLEELITSLWDGIDYIRHNIDSLHTILSNDIEDEDALRALYGQYSYGGMTFIMDQSQPKLYVFLMLLYTALSSQCGYKYIIAETWHPTALAAAKMVTGNNAEINRFKFNEMRDFTFRDGTEMNDVLNAFVYKHAVKPMPSLSVVLHRIKHTFDYVETAKSNFIKEKINKTA